MQEKKEKQDPIIAALKLRATGFDAEDIVEEYVYDKDGNERLSKIKKSYYKVVPDMTAIKILLDLEKGDGELDLTEEELVRERERLLGLLAKSNKKQIK